MRDAGGGLLESQCNRRARDEKIKSFVNVAAFVERRCNRYNRTSLSASVMKRSLDELASGLFDVLVIGGGITGAGIALDATLRGLRVALIDKGDFGSGTSSASSKLVHGGLRYLELAEFALVRESLRERHVLLRLAPHLVRPLRILLPHYAGATRPRWLVKLGLTLYDWLAGRENIAPHRPLAAPAIQAQVPGLRGEGLRGGFEFYDAQMDDARLCLEVVLTAAASGARVANYVEAVEIRQDPARQARRCEVMDRLAGACFYIHARRVINAAGPWVDEVCRIENSAHPPHLAPTKGVHIVLPGTGLSMGLLLSHPQDGRVLFVIPWMNRTLVGTTDTFFEDRPDAVRPEVEDVAYLLSAYNHYFSPSRTVSEVLASLAGLRPLVRARTAKPSAVSREFSVFRSESGLWSIAGGKYTTYRRMAEYLVDQVVNDLGGSHRATPSCTRGHRLIGAPSEDWKSFRTLEQARLADSDHLDPTIAGHLVDRYGCRARLLVQEYGGVRTLWKPLVTGEPDVMAEWHFQRAHELAQCPADHLLRRSRIGLFHPELLSQDHYWNDSKNSRT
jgi:glycerol-3-phosphate dehydrogenase